jgi:Amiloride-sensitive sodium channel
VFVRKFDSIIVIIILRSSDFFQYEDQSIYQLKERLNDLLPWNISHTQDALFLKIYKTVENKGRDYSDSNPFEPFDGYRIIIHNNDELPSYSGYQLYHMDFFETKVSIVPEINLLDNDVKALNLGRRNCFLPHEKSLKYFKVYTKKNCEQECLSSMMKEACDCTQFYVIS